MIDSCINTIIYNLLFLTKDDTISTTSLGTVNCGWCPPRLSMYVFNFGMLATPYHMFKKIPNLDVDDASFGETLDKKE